MTANIVVALVEIQNLVDVDLVFVSPFHQFVYEP